MSTCKRPPGGWACTREVGHEGPCAAVVTRKGQIIKDAVNDIAGLYDGPPHGGYEKIEQVIQDAVNEAISRLRNSKQFMSTQNQDQATPGEVPMAKNLAQLEVLARAHNVHPGYIDAPCAPRTEFETAHGIRQASVDHTVETSDLLSKQAWTLKCLTEDVRGLSKALHGEQRANATLALRHLEDAHHRMTLAQSE